MEIYTVRGVCGLQPQKEAFVAYVYWLPCKVLITPLNMQFPYRM
jgi:hypothetical protein